MALKRYRREFSLRDGKIVQTPPIADIAKLIISKTTCGKRLKVGAEIKAFFIYDSELEEYRSIFCLKVLFSLPSAIDGFFVTHIVETAKDDFTDLVDWITKNAYDSFDVFVNDLDYYWDNDKVRQSMIRLIKELTKKIDARERFINADAKKIKELEKKI